ncbi:probable inactive receptor kinase At1g48480 [Syzygium oleosum]|uniref:probable inactive receptor kinase At1g48480 n=1 Tax=Syzygium oleosum TaxID=219896 RepID=UPI0024BAEED1|nr:probable inactive receptor kinase At1g48480 [Syzygium oleosum]
MNNLWRRIGNRKSSSKSTSEKNETLNKPQEPEPEKNATQNKPQEPEPERKDLVLLGNPAKRFDLEDLFRASVEVLGKGTVGTTYKAHLDDGTTVVVVKRLNHVVLSAEDFGDKVVALGVMDHKNLLPLRGYYDSKDVKILLYDYMTLGSLSDQLHGFREILLSWQVRLSIALGAARAIEHLHSQASHHGNIKSSNVLLTPSYEARVSDYSLPHLTRPASMAGADPSKADVYDFGMLLLELLTGKPPTQTLLNVEGQSVDLPTWVESVVCESRPTWVEVFDVDPQDIEVAMFELLGLATRCVTSNSPMRPRMSEVRRMIEELCGPGEQWDLDSQPDDVYEETEYADSWLIGNTQAENALSWPIDNAQVDRGSQLNQFSEVNGDMYTRKPPDGVMEVSERVYVFEYCLTTDWSFFGQITTDWLKNDEYENYMRGVVARLQDQFPAAPFMVLNFGEQENQSQIA